MVKARVISSSFNSIKRKLYESTWQWNNRPGWDYVGKPRVIWGNDVDARSFSIRALTDRGIIWTIDRQAWAVEQGFFVGREIIRERPVIISINRFEETFSYFHPYKAMQEIERRAFRREPGYVHLLAFIEQQDKYGYTGAWDIKVQLYTPDLLWYKLYVAKLGGMAKRKEQLRRAAAVARDAKHVNRVRRLIKDGHKPSQHL